MAAHETVAAHEDGHRRTSAAGASAFIAALVAVGLLLGCFGVAGCQYRAGSESAKAAQAERRRAQAPDQVSTDARLYLYKNDRPRAYLKAAHMERYEREDSTYALLHSFPDSLGGRVTVHLFNEKGDSTATLTANRLVYQDGKERFDARGRVLVTTQEGKRLESEHLTWLEDEKRVRTPGFVRLTTPTDRIEGYGLRSDENLENYHLRRVTGQVTVEEGA